MLSENTLWESLEDVHRTPSAREFMQYVTAVTRHVHPAPSKYAREEVATALLDKFEKRWGNSNDGLEAQACLAFALGRTEKAELTYAQLELQQRGENPRKWIVAARFSRMWDTFRDMPLSDKSEITMHVAAIAGTWWAQDILTYAAKFARVTPLDLATDAARGGNVDLLHFIHQKDCKVLTFARYPDSPLEVALVNDHTNAVRFLVRAGAPILDTNVEQTAWTPLTDMLCKDDSRIHEVLLEKHKTMIRSGLINGKLIFGQVLSDLSSCCSGVTLRWFVHRGFNINARQPSDGMTLAHVAAYWLAKQPVGKVLDPRRKAFIKSMVNCVADIHALNDAGESALRIAPAIQDLRDW